MIFKPARHDGRAAWEVVYGLVVPLSPGDTVTYETLMQELKTNDKHIVYSAVARCNRRLWKDRQRSLKVVPGVGYRVLHPLEHEEQSDKFRVQGKRKIRNALQVMKATDLSTLTGEQQNWVTKLVSGLSLMAAAVDAHAAKLVEHETILKSLTKRVEKIEGTVKK